MKAISMAFLAAAALTACANAPGETVASGIERYADDPRLGEETQKICFASNIDGFSMNERRTVVLHDGSKRYMVETSGGCFDLDSAQSIALDSTSSCLTPGDSLIVAQAFSSAQGPQRCLIRDIYLWDPKAKSGDPAAGEENPS